MTHAAMVAERSVVDALRRGLARERVLLEVRRDAAGEADWRAVTGAEPFDWQAPVALAGAKRFFFPPREALLRWSADRIEEVAAPKPPFVLFGLHACDLAAIAYQDRFFAGDAWYSRRRERALLVGLDCLAACAGGFCRDVDAGPFARAGFDLALTPLDRERVLIRLGTPRGMEAFTAARLAAGPADGAVHDAFAAAEAHACSTFPTRAFVARGIARLNEGGIDDTEWQRLGPACFACTGCTSLCPTCSCFTLVDEGGAPDGERVRCWDSCLLEGFQREASGHHPAPRPGDRVRRFWYHKLSRDFAVNLGRLGCVGCGRCDATCPGSIGASRVLEALASR